MVYFFDAYKVSFIEVLNMIVVNYLIGFEVVTSMFLLGTIVNGVLIIIGSFLGRVLSRIPEKTKETVMNGIGLAVIVMGLQMGFEK